MSDSLIVRATSPVELNVMRLKAEICEVARFILNQGDEFCFDMEFLGRSGKCGELLLPDGDIYTINEKKELRYGVLFTYGLDENWEMYSKVPTYEFSIIEIARRNDDLMLVMCISTAIAVAKLMKVGSIFDYDGVWSDCGDEVSIDNLLGLAIDKKMPLHEAMICFYKKLPAFKIR